MLSLSAILGIIGAAIVGIFGAYFGGKAKAKSAARVEQVGIDAARVVQSNNAATEAQVKAVKKASDETAKVSASSSNDVASELRNNWTRD